MAKIKKLYKKTGKDTKELVYPVTITQAIKDGETGQNLHDYMNDVKPKFKFDATQTDSQDGTVGTIMLSQDGGKTWNPISPEFTNNLHIAGYVATTSALPANKPVGTIYGVGPTYATEDTAQTNPIYRIYVYNGTTWVDNGQFTSIAAGIVQETGDSETEVMSQKATTEKLTELGSELYKKNEAVFSKAGMFINGSTGAVESGGSDWKATDFIDVRNTEKIEFRLGTSGGATSIAYYSSTDESSYLSGSGNTSINNVVIISHKDFPVNTSYIRFSKRLSESPNGYARTYDRELQNIYRTIPIIEADVERAKDDISAIKTETSSLQSEVDSLKFNITNAFFTISEKFINSADGALEQAAAFSSTEAISLQSVLRCEVNIGTNGGATSVAYYSSEDTSSYISGVGNTSMSNPLILLQSDFPTEAKYVRFCKRGDMSNGGFVRIFKDKAESNIDEETIKFNYEGKYINGEDGLLYNGSDFAYTDAVRLENLRKIVVNISTAGGASSATYYDGSGNRVGSVGNTTMGTPITIKEFPREASFVRFCKRISTSVGGTVLIYAEDSNAINRKLDNHWKGRVISAYGDSVTAICNGDFKMPYKADYSQNWLNKTAKFYSMKSAHGRGIGGQSYQWGYKGGTLTIVDEYGNYVNRVYNNTYDDYLSNPSIVNLLEGQSCTRGCLSSWDRITKMYPSTIKDTIDVVLVMCHNDAEGSGSFDEEVKFVEGSQTDKEWAESSTYSKYGGDYNLTSVKGSIASTVMKLQEWLPNATIVLMTPISGRGITGKLNLNLIDEPMQKVADCVREVHRLMSIPLIDMYATCGINGLNRTRYITDGIHPYSIEGGNMLAKAVVGGLNGIVHNLF